MAQYRVNQVSYINDRIVLAGEIVDFEGIPGPHMEALSPKEAKASEANSEKALRDEAKRLNAQVEITGTAGAPSTWRPLTDDDSVEVVRVAIATAKLNRTD